MAFVSIFAVALSGIDQATAQTLQSGDIVSASVDTANSGPAIKGSFIGFSLEWGTFKEYSGLASETNPIFAQLLKNVNTGSGPARLRIGGDSSDKRWWNPDNKPFPPGITVNTQTKDFDNIEAVASQTGSKIVLGLNMAQNVTQYAVDLAKAALANFPESRIAAFEIGNEANNYATKPYYTDANGNTVVVRPSGYSSDQYRKEFGAFSSALTNQVNNVPSLSALSYAGNAFMEALPTFLASEANELSICSIHRGFLANSNKYKLPVTIENLLAESTAHDWAASQALYVDQCGAYGVGFVLGDASATGSDAGNGVSNTMAAALWGTDLAFELAQTGFSGVNWRAAPNVEFDQPFKFTESGGVYTPTINPLYYGIMLFANATANQARLLPVSTTDTGNIKIWATKDNQGTTRVVALNKDLNVSGNARIQLAGTSGSATLVRLSAPSISAKTGLTLAGQTFDGTKTGKPVGTYTSTSLNSSSGTYVFSLPKGSAAMLTIPSGGATVQVGLLLDQSSYAKGEKMYAQATSTASPTQVKFYLDNKQVWTEKISPYWLGGDSNTGSTSQATGYSTSGLAVGSHTLKAVSVVNGVSYSSSNIQFQVN
ncbi:MAG: hypothetical protein H7Y22_15225 [Gemmatimonadaceae bacterium]|nr:hypothetical protein [Gloeobacterales cyanobacterium ES-bin-141]